MEESATNENDADLASAGISAYQSGDYQSAIKIFRDLSTRAADPWNARLYLGMAYFKTSKTSYAIQEFKDIVQWCKDPLIKEKALTALSALSRQSQHESGQQRANGG
jgi:hypothetical protein